MTKVKNNINNEQIKNGDPISSAKARIPLPKEAMHSLREQLPHGSINLLMQRCALSRVTINKILEGDSCLNDKSQRVIDEAKVIIHETKEATAALAIEIASPNPIQA